MTDPEQEEIDDRISDLTESWDGADLVTTLSVIWDVDYADSGISTDEFVDSKLVQEIISATQSNPHIDEDLKECFRLLHPQS